LTAYEAGRLTTRDMLRTQLGENCHSLTRLCGPGVRSSGNARENDSQRTPVEAPEELSDDGWANTQQSAASRKINCGAALT
jgi:hypothetical protein